MFFVHAQIFINNPDPLSLTCESIVAPKLLQQLLLPYQLAEIKYRQNGDIIPAAVIMATVADPCVTQQELKRAHARNTTGIDEPAIDSARITPIPLSTRI